MSLYSSVLVYSYTATEFASEEKQEQQQVETGVLEMECERRVDTPSDMDLHV